MSYASAEGVDPRLAGLSGRPAPPRAFQLADDEGDEDDWLEEQRGMLRALARLGMEMALDIGAEARTLQQRRGLGAEAVMAAAADEADATLDLEDDDAQDEPPRGWTDLALAFSRVSRAIRQCIETDVKITAYQAAKTAADRPGARSGGRAEQPSWPTPEEREQRDNKFVTGIQRAMDVIAENHVYRAIQMLEGEDPDTSLIPAHEGSVTWRAATGAILKACRDLSLARYRAHFDAGWNMQGAEFEDDDDDGADTGEDSGEPDPP